MNTTARQGMYLLRAAAHGEDVDFGIPQARAVLDYIEAGNDALAACQSQAAGRIRVLVAAIRELHPSTGCDPYEPCPLCKLAEYT